MKIEFEKQFGKGIDPWYAKAERWAKKQKFPISFLALGFIEWLKNKWIDVKVANTMRDIDRQSEEIKEILEEKITQDKQITEYMLANLVPKLWPAENPIMLSASSPIRDWLTFSENGTLTRNCFSFRGASGIDGTLSLALGISRIKNPLLLVTGDLAFIHDINGWLIENSIDLNLTILLLGIIGYFLFSIFLIHHLEHGLA